MSIGWWKITRFFHSLSVNFCHRGFHGLHMKKSRKKEKKGKCLPWELLRRYLENSNVHGFKYLVEADRHWTEWIFWWAMCGVSWWLCGLVVYNTVEFATSHDVSTTMPTGYLEWEAEVPAFHFCVTNNQRLKEGFNAAKIKGENRFINWANLGYNKAFRDLEGKQLMEMIKLTKPKCEEIFSVCRWNDQEFDCCKVMFPLSSTVGQCLSFNSYQTRRPSDPTLPRFVVNHKARSTTFTLIFNKTKKISSRMFVTNQYDYPTETAHPEKRLRSRYDLGYLTVLPVTVVPTHNTPEVIRIPMSRRGCRMSWENHDNLLTRLYNRDGCIMEQQMRTMYGMFNCVSHIFPRVPTMRLCSIAELEAANITEGSVNNKRITKVATAPCMPDCEGTVVEFSSLEYSSQPMPPGALMQIDIVMLPGPSIIYKRYTTRSLLQVIISVGSVVGLFMGASLLSIVEVLYWFCLRRGV